MSATVVTATGGVDEYAVLVHKRFLRFRKTKYALGMTPKLRTGKKMKPLVPVSA